MSKSRIMELFATNVRKCLTAYGWTARDLSDATGIHQPNISRILHGKERVTIDRANVIAEALEVPLSELLSETFQIRAMSA